METRTSEYMVTYTVPALNRYEALMKAGALLRTAVRIVGEAEATQGTGDWWAVTFVLAEDYQVPESADPVTAAKGAADRESWTAS